MIKILSLMFAIVLGLLLSLAVPFPKDANARACNYEYCSSNGYCYANQNGTNCYGNLGNYPCTSSKPCAPADPGEG